MLQPKYMYFSCDYFLLCHCLFSQWNEYS